MRALTTFVVLVIGLVLPGSAQEAKATAFAIKAPEGWHLMTREGVVDNLGRLQMSASERRKLLANAAVSTPVVTYMKYQPTAKVGLIPKIDVVLRSNPTTTFEAFFKMMSTGPAQLKALFPDFKLTEPMREVRVGGRRAVLMSAVYSIETSNAGRLSTRGLMYAVMDGDAFFQISLTDGPTDDCAAVFAQVMSTIRFD